MQSTDPYAVLGVSCDATQAEIAHAYRALVRRHHPDLCDTAGQAEGSAAALARVLHAYAMLRDPERRAAHDRLHQPAAPTTEVGRTERGQARSAPHQQPPLRAGPVLWHPGRPT